MLVRFLVLAVAFFLASLLSVCRAAGNSGPEMGKPAKVEWSDSRLEIDDFSGGNMVVVEFVSDRELAAAVVRVGASLEDFLTVVSPVGPIAAPADIAVQVTLQLSQTPDEAGRSLGGVLRVQEDGRNLAKPLSVSLRRIMPDEGDGGNGQGGVQGAGPKAQLTWDPDLLTDESFGGASAQPTFAPSGELGEVVIWLSGGLRRCLEVTGGGEFESVPADAVTAFQVTLLAALEELDKPCAGTIHVRSAGGNRRTFGPPLGVRIGVQGNEEESEPIIAEAVTDGASFEQSAIAPGQLVSIFGQSLGPNDLVVFEVGPDGVATELDGIIVLFDGLPGPVLSAIAGQINTIVPQGVSGEDADLTIVRNGRVSVSFPLPAAPLAPNLFTLDASGRGPAAALNSDGSINSPGRPASVGAALMLFASGAGPTAPGLADGEVAGPNPLPLAGSTSATIGGLPAAVLYSGSSPGLVNGVTQWNLRIPEGLETGSHAVLITVDEVSSNGRATVEVE